MALQCFMLEDRSCSQVIMCLVLATDLALLIVYYYTLLRAGLIMNTVSQYITLVTETGLTLLSVRLRFTLDTDLTLFTV